MTYIDTFNAAFERCPLIAILRGVRPDEVEACSPYLVRQLELIRPKVILAFGQDPELARLAGWFLRGYMWVIPSWISTLRLSTRRNLTMSS